MLDHQSFFNRYQMMVQESQKPPAAPSSIKKTIVTNGYAYPTANLGIVSAALPILTYLSLFSYQIRPNGSLNTINDTPFIAAAYKQKTAPKMVITNIGQGGSFDSQLASTTLNDPALEDTLLANVLAVMEEEGYLGLDIDFEYLFPTDREAYNRFLEKAAQVMHEHNFTLSTAIAPKTSADQRGLLYEAHDYPVHGKYDDYVIIMTYEWGHTFGPPRAVAPLNEVRRVLDYAVTAIPRHKILMGIPNYAYDWTLPYTPGTPARSLSNPQAAQLALEQGVPILFDNTAESPYFYYTDNSGARHVVWFENEESMSAKLRLVSEYQLGGVSYWTVNNELTPGLAAQQQAMYQVKKVIP